MSKNCPRPGEKCTEFSCGVNQDCKCDAEVVKKPSPPLSIIKETEEEINKNND